MAEISANELKTKSVLAIQTALEQQTEAVISVRGKDRFVVMNLTHYQYLRECELTAKKWSMPIRDWKPALNQFMILYEDRFPEIF